MKTTIAILIASLVLIGLGRHDSLTKPADCVRNSIYGKGFAVGKDTNAPQSDWVFDIPECALKGKGEGK
jgi:hypothetical protein